VWIIEGRKFCFLISLLFHQTLGWLALRLQAPEMQQGQGFPAEGRNSGLSIRFHQSAESLSSSGFQQYFQI
jgi:hypothetical protein